jgi:hypothetical protein
LAIGQEFVRRRCYKVAVFAETDKHSGDDDMNTQQQNRKMTGVSRAAFTGILAAGLVMHTLTANAADSYQEKVLFEPHQSQRLAEARGRIMIYDGLDSTVVDKAMDEQFDRIDNMMFVRTHHSSEEGEDYVDDDGC